MYYWLFDECRKYFVTSYLVYQQQGFNIKKIGKYVKISRADSKLKIFVLYFENSLKKFSRAFQFVKGLISVVLCILIFKVLFDFTFIGKIDFPIHFFHEVSGSYILPRVVVGAGCIFGIAVFFTLMICFLIAKAKVKRKKLIEWL